MVKLTPPRISHETILREVVCTRPMREGNFNISAEQHGQKTLVNCYGHGGSGWSALFGSVKKAIKLFQNTDPHKNMPIRVIGAGCMGLTTAIELARLGYQVAGIFTTGFDDISSWRAAGYFAFISIKTDPEEQASVNEIGLESFLTYREIEQGRHPYLTQDTVKWMPVFCSMSTKAGIEILEASGMIPLREYVSLDFGNGVIHHGFVKYMSYFMQTTLLMHQLTVEAKRLGIKIDLKTVHSFDDLAERVIFNCSGLGASQLNQDEKIIPVRGHLVMLNAAAGLGHMDYMLHTQVEQDGREEYIYMFPKSLFVSSEHRQGIPCRGLLGGTFIPRVDRLSMADQEELDRLEFKRLLDRHSQFFYG